MELEKWKEQAHQFADELGICDLWASDDPYDLSGSALDAFEQGQSPEDFVRRFCVERILQALEEQD